jgi:hypothetical protein
MFLAALAVATPALAQTLEDAARRVSPGETVLVFDASSRETRGILQSITATFVTLAGQPNLEIPTKQIYRIDKLGDPSWDGFAKGAAIGAGAGLLLSSFVCSSEDGASCRFAAAGGYAVTWGLVGWLIDWAHEGRTTIFKASDPSAPHLTLAPVVGGGRKGIAVSFGF